MPCGNLCRWIKSEKSLEMPPPFWVRGENVRAVESRTEEKRICKLKSRVVLHRTLGLITKDNRPLVQGRGQGKPQLIVLQLGGAHNMRGYYRPIPPKLPRTTRILRATAL